MSADDQVREWKRAVATRNAMLRNRRSRRTPPDPHKPGMHVILPPARGEPVTDKPKDGGKVPRGGGAGKAPAGNAEKRPFGKKPNAAGRGGGPPKPPKPETKPKKTAMPP